MLVAVSSPRGFSCVVGRLSILTPEECVGLCNKYGVKCVIDLRTPVESAEFPDPLPEGIEYLQIPLLNDAAVGITHETGSDPMTIIKNLRKHPEKPEGDDTRLQGSLYRHRDRRILPKPIGKSLSGH